MIMALRNQPYFPLYVDDYLTDEKLNLCSASTQGVYIKILCILHKQDEYGKLLLKQKDKHLPEICLNFAYKLALLLPFTENIIHSALVELLEEKVLYIENDYLCQKRMIKDEIVSKKRAESGSKGGKKTQFALANALAKSEANSVNENEIVIKDVIKTKKDNKMTADYFEKFWDIYPNKVNKKKAKEKFMRLDFELFETIMYALEWQTQSISWKNGYIPNPETYINNEKWNDKPKPIVNNNGNGKVKQVDLYKELGL